MDIESYEEAVNALQAVLVYFAEPIPETTEQMQEIHELLERIKGASTI